MPRPPGNPTTDAPPPIPPAGAGRIARAASLTGRLLTIGAILAVGGWTASTWSELLSDPAPRPSPAADAAGLDDDGPAGWLAAPVADGAWSFGDLPAGLAVRRVPASDLAVALRTTSDRPAPEGPPGAEEARWIALARQLADQIQDHGPESLYLLDRPDVRAALITRHREGHERLLNARLAWPEVEGEWALLDVSLGARPDATAGAASLLPPGSGGRSLGLRRDGRGQVLGELAVAEAGLPALRDAWRRRGYEVHLPFDAAAGAPVFSCRRDGEHLRVWVLGPAAGPSSRSPVVLVVREPGAGAASGPAD